MIEAAGLLLAVLANVTAWTLSTACTVDPVIKEMDN
jgi:hypothetical protein